MVRCQPVNADAGGVLGMFLDNTSPEGYGITPGATRYFQAWYRDLTGPSGFNLSDGLRVEFTP
jgi:hypothetical protein